MNVRVKVNRGLMYRVSEQLNAAKLILIKSLVRPPSYLMDKLLGTLCMLNHDFTEGLKLEP
jgi:hypothetical protein